MAPSAGQHVTNDVGSCEGGALPVIISIIGPRAPHDDRGFNSGVQGITFEGKAQLNPKRKRKKKKKNENENKKKKEKRRRKRKKLAHPAELAR